ARKILDATEWQRDPRKGCRILRFLGTDDAVTEMVRRYGSKSDSGCDSEYTRGLFGAPNREHVVRALEAGLRSETQPVTGSYLRTLAILSVLFENPDLRPKRMPEIPPRVETADETQRRILVDAAVAKYTDVLNAALPGKTAAARAITLADLSGYSYRPS